MHLDAPHLSSMSRLLGPALYFAKALRGDLRSHRIYRRLLDAVVSESVLYRTPMHIRQIVVHDAP